ncbi:hypothetical protein [Wenxinia saemankumensis]|uniref:Uncharacterized protein n=1 Tax=Wenxinia saemankumensis TaxID=1447782 RepID=A0A1M6BVL3_9RHOB|nr:hypothetical protein [Wenxinia saemankumensis]SHI52697.1 hypothetical protein SAMN05444417_0869 [Wenxinia saemankumensis]
MPTSKKRPAKAAGKAQTRKHDLQQVSRVPPGLNLSGKGAKGGIKPLPLPGKSRGR